MKPRNLLTDPTRSPLVAASILSADFARLQDDSQAAIDAGADLLHVDIMDAHFVPNLSMGPAIASSLRKAMPDVFMDVHLMVTDPETYIRRFADAGADSCTFHIEVVPEPGPLVDLAHELGMTAGLALNPDTPVEQILPHVELPDMILVMSVHPGFSGQSFISEVLEKMKQVRPLLRPDQRIEVDGGVSPATAASCREAGADVLVSASAIFGSDDYRREISALAGS